MEHRNIRSNCKASMTILGAILLVMFIEKTAGKLEQIEFQNDSVKDWVSPPDGILIGEDTPVYRVKADKASEAGYSFCRRQKAIEGMKKWMEKKGKDAVIRNKNDNPALTSKIIDPNSKDVPDIIYPQILVVVSYNIFRRFKSKLSPLLVYLAAFWNQVQLRFRALINPKVRLNIAGIIVPRDANTFTFISENKNNAKLVNAEGVLNAFGKLMGSLKNHFPFDTYDIAVFMDSSNHRGGASFPPPKIDYDLDSTISATCADHNSASSKTRSVTVIQDKGALDGVRSAALNLAVLFGVKSDSNPGCEDSKGFMASQKQCCKKRWYLWSECSLKAMDAFFKSGKATCLFNKPTTTSPLPRILSGKLLTADEQCKRLGAKKSSGAPQCSSLRCENAGRKKDAQAPLADGVYCDKNKICIHGQCRDEGDLMQ